METLTSTRQRVLFLDFDGVIITPRSHIAFGKIGGMMDDPDPVALGIIRRVCDTGVRIVVSSTWRNLEGRCLRFLEQHELRAYLHADWRTPSSARDVGGIYVSKSRGSEIAAWLKNHPEVRSYRILDDDTDMLPEQMPFFIECLPHEGVGYIAAKHLLQWAGVLPNPKEAA